VDGLTTVRFQAWVSSMCRVMTLTDAGCIALGYPESRSVA
jgi:hypothetical protein